MTFDLGHTIFNGHLRGELWFFVSFRNFFSDNTRVRILIFFVAESAKKKIQNLILGYMTKTLNQIFFFPPSKSEYFFSNIGNQNIFLEKNHMGFVLISL